MKELSYLHREGKNKGVKENQKAKDKKKKDKMLKRLFLSCFVIMVMKLF